MTKPTFKNIDSALIALMLAALAIRLWGLDFGLPHPWARPDESRLVIMAMKFGQGNLNPPFFHYPTLYPYLLAFAFGLYYLLGGAIGMHTSTFDFSMLFATDPTNFFLIDRTFSAVMGSLTVLAVYLIAGRMFDRKAALLSSFFLAFAYLHERDSHFGVTDIPMTCLIIYSIYFIIRAAESGRRKHYMIAGILAGLAASTKYAGAFLVLPMLIAHWQVTAREQLSRLRFFIDIRILLFVLAIIVGFLLGTPYAILDFRRFIGDLSYEMQHLHWGHMGVVLDRGWWYHLHVSLYHGLGWPLLLTSMCGIVLLIMKKPRTAFPLLAFPLFYYLWVGQGYTVFVRYVIPVIPFLCITAAFFCLWLVDRLSLRTSRARGTLIVALAVAVIAPSFYNCIKYDTLLSETDNRLLATDWITDNLPSGSSVYQVNAGGGALQLNPGQYFLEKCVKYEDMISSDQQTAPNRGLLGLVIDSLISLRQFDLWTYDSLANQFSSDGSTRNELPIYVVAERVPLFHYNAMPARIDSLLKNEYHLLKEFIAFDTTAANLYDLQDHFYVPFAGFDGVERPGPNLCVYELTSSE